MRLCDKHHTCATHEKGHAFLTRALEFALATGQRDLKEELEVASQVTRFHAVLESTITCPVCLYGEVQAVDEEGVWRSGVEAYMRNLSRRVAARRNLSQNLV